MDKSKILMDNIIICLNGGNVTISFNFDILASVTQPYNEYCCRT